MGRDRPTPEQLALLAPVRAQVRAALRRRLLRKLPRALVALATVAASIVLARRLGLSREAQLGAVGGLLYALLVWRAELGASPRGELRFRLCATAGCAALGGEIICQALRVAAAGEQIARPQLALLLPSALLFGTAFAWLFLRLGDALVGGPAQLALLPFPARRWFIDLDDHHWIEVEALCSERNAATVAVAIHDDIVRDEGERYPSPTLALHPFAGSAVDLRVAWSEAIAGPPHARHAFSPTRPPRASDAGERHLGALELEGEDGATRPVGSDTLRLPVLASAWLEVEVQSRLPDRLALIVAARSDRRGERFAPCAGLQLETSFGAANLVRFTLRPVLSIAIG